MLARLFCPQEARAKEVVAGDRHAAAAIRRPHALGVAVEGATSPGAGGAGDRSRGICLTATRIAPIPVLAPLPHVPVHVIQAPWVR